MLDKPRLDRRLEVLFSRDEYTCLKLVADKEGRPIGELVREAVRDKYLITNRKDREEAVRRLLSGDLALEWPEWKEIENAIARQGGHGVEAD